MGINTINLRNSRLILTQNLSLRERSVFELLQILGAGILVGWDTRIVWRESVHKRGIIMLAAVTRPLASSTRYLNLNTRWRVIEVLRRRSELNARFSNTVFHCCTCSINVVANTLHRFIYHPNIFVLERVRMRVWLVSFVKSSGTPFRSGISTSRNT